MTGNHVYFVAFDRAREFDLRLLGNDAVAEYRCHFLGLGFLQVQFGGNLLVGKVQTHKIQTQHPHGQRLVMPGKHGFGQVVKRPATFPAKVMLAIGLDDIASVFDNVSGMAMGTFDAFGPAELSYHLVALGVVDLSVNVQSHPAFLCNFRLTILCKLPNFGYCTKF